MCGLWMQMTVRKLILKIICEVEIVVVLSVGNEVMASVPIAVTTGARHPTSVSVLKDRSVNGAAEKNRVEDILSVERLWIFLERLQAPEIFLIIDANIE